MSEVQHLNKERSLKRKKISELLQCGLITRKNSKQTAVNSQLFDVSKEFLKFNEIENIEAKKQFWTEKP